MIDKRQFIGKYCDIQTKDGVWRLGAIEGKREDKEIVEVSLDGWSSNKNQVGNIIYILFLLENLLAFESTSTSKILF